MRLFCVFQYVKPHMKCVFLGEQQGVVCLGKGVGGWGRGWLHMVNTALN